MHWKLCRVPGIYYLMQKCRAQTEGLVVLFSLPVIALEPGDASVYENGEGWSLKLVQVQLALCCGTPAALCAFLEFIPLAQGLTPHCTPPAPLGQGWKCHPWNCCLRHPAPGFVLN